LYSTASSVERADRSITGCLQCAAGQIEDNAAGPKKAATIRSESWKAWST